MKILEFASLKRKHRISLISTRVRTLYLVSPSAASYLKLSPCPYLAGLWSPLFSEWTNFVKNKIKNDFIVKENETRWRIRCHLDFDRMMNWVAADIRVSSEKREESQVCIKSDQVSQRKEKKSAFEWIFWIKLKWKPLQSLLSFDFSFAYQIKKTHKTTTECRTQFQ